MIRRLSRWTKAKPSRIYTCNRQLLVVRLPTSQRVSLSKDKDLLVIGSAFQGMSLYSPILTYYIPEVFLKKDKKWMVLKLQVLTYYTLK